MKSLVCAAVAGLMLSGCVCMKDDRTEWVELADRRVGSGPGSEDGRFVFWHRDQYLFDPGTRLSVGVFPGWGQAWVDGSVDGVSFANSLWFLPIWSTFANLVFLAPTFSSLFVAPCVEAKLSSFGFLGCHRWSVDPVEERVRTGPRETVVLTDESKPAWQEGALAPGKSGDGTTLYLAYPGFGRLLAEVKAKGQADVMFDRGPSAYRRFRLSKNVPDALVYRDVPQGRDPAADAQIARARAGGQ